MADFLSQLGRSERMSRIRSRDTKPELLLRKALHRLGLRYRLGGAGLPGKPDLVFPRYKVVVFVHGCFWHRHAGCRIATNPKTNITFWNEKFERNVERDSKVVSDLETLGWRVLVVWECEISSKKRLALTVVRLAGEIVTAEDELLGDEVRFDSLS